MPANSRWDLIRRLRVNAECRLTIIVLHPPSLLEIMHWNSDGAPVLRRRRRHRCRRRYNMSFIYFEQRFISWVGVLDMKRGGGVKQCKVRVLRARVQ